MVTYHNKTKMLKLYWKNEYIYIAKHIALLTFSALPGAFTHPRFCIQSSSFLGVDHIEPFPVHTRNRSNRYFAKKNHRKKPQKKRFPYGWYISFFFSPLKKLEVWSITEKKSHPAFLVEKRRQRGRRFAEVHDILQRHVSCLGMATIGTRLCT